MNNDERTLFSFLYGMYHRNKRPAVPTSLFSSSFESFSSLYPYRLMMGTSDGLGQSLQMLKKLLCLPSHKIFTIKDGWFRHEEMWKSEMKKATKGRYWSETYFGSGLFW